MDQKAALLDDSKRRKVSNCLDNDALYSIVGPLIKEGMTAKTCRRFVSVYEEEHFPYFSLFKPSFERDGKTWIENARQDIKNIRTGGVVPLLREFYAICEVISRNVIIMHELEEGGKVGILIEPLISGTEYDRNMPLILLLTFREECIHVIKSDESIEHLESDGVMITNAEHSKCLDRRFRNNFDDLQNFLLKIDELPCTLNFSTEDLNTSSDETTNLFRLFGMMIYGSAGNEKDIKVLLKSHMEQSHYRDTYMKQVKYNKEAVAGDKKKQERELQKRMEEAFKEHLNCWKSAEIVDFFALASVFNVQVFAVSPNGSNTPRLYLPICGNYMYTFKSSFIFERTSDEQLFDIFLERIECLCLQNTPEITGQFPVYNNKIDLDNIQKHNLKPCCPPKNKRHGRHQHYQNILGNKTLKIETDDTPWPGSLDDVYMRINELLVEEGRQLNMINGGKGTLSQCLSKEIYGDEDTELEISLPKNIEEALEKIAEWTGFVVYIFRYSLEHYEHYSWTIKKPATLVNKNRCRYYINIAIIEKNGKIYVDRIVSNYGCNCMQMPPNVKRVKVIVGDERISKAKRHRPLITFFPTKPSEDWFCDDLRREETIIPIHSEFRLVMERSDMEDRLIDIVSDYTHSLYRCISKDVFGDEKHYDIIMKEIIADIVENSNEYGQFLKAEKEQIDDEVFENFKFRDHRFSDFFRSQSQILKKCAVFLTERIEDGMSLEDLELIAAATCFQVPIYVLTVNINEDKMETEWKLFTQIRRRKQPDDFLRRRQYLAGENAVYKCLLDEDYVSKFYVTLFRTCSGQFHRITPIRKVCNCLIDPPDAFHPKKHNHDDDQDFQHFYETHHVKTKLNIAKLALDNWMRCNMALEILCTDIIDELEGRRRNVNISNIVGSSIGMFGSALAVAGVIVAPFTAGVSLGLTVGGAVIGSLSSVTVVGANITETVLNKDANEKFERYFMNISEHSRIMVRTFEDLEKEMEKIELTDTDEIDTAKLQTAAGALHMIGGVPVVIARIILRAASFVDTILPPLSAIIDFGVLGYNIFNLVKGSKTNVTEKLRSQRTFLRASRTQLMIYAYGNKKTYLKAVDFARA